MPDRDPDVRLAIEHSIRVLGRWTIVLYFAVAAVLGFAIVETRIHSEAHHADISRIDTALCTFVDDLARRVEASEDFLKKHPGPEPIPGISRSDLRHSIQNQRKTLRSLSGLECPA